MSWCIVACQNSGILTALGVDSPINGVFVMLDHFEDDVYEYDVCFHHNLQSK
jgi:hypothetical protein